MGFVVYPAIDLKGGQVVRLRQGEMADATVYGTDPAAQAASFAAMGAEWLHVVDLDGAFAGQPVNGEAVAAVLAAVQVPVQLGGGIRDMAGVEAWLAAGIARVILGSAAARDPQFARAACRAFPGRIAIGIDARDGRVATQGWAETTDLHAHDLARRFADAGAAAIVFTDIGRDGMLAGPNVAATASLAAVSEVPVIASGGVTTAADLAALRQAHQGIAGAVVGRALYDGRLTLPEALRAGAA